MTYDARRNPKGYRKTEDYDSDECPFCAEESCQILLLGDQFLPQSARVDTLRLTTADTPKWVASFLRKTEGKRIIRCQYGRGLRDRVHEQFFDISPLFRKSSRGDQAFRNNLRKAITQCLPASLNIVIFIDDKISRRLARLVKTESARSQPRKKVQLLNAQTVIRAPEKFQSTTGTTMVVAGCILTGRSLMELSQVLRTVQKNGSIVFFVGLSRCETRRVFEEIEDNVTFTRDRSRRFGFHCVQQINVPDSTSFRESIWTQETHFLRRLRRHFAENEHFPSDILQGRIHQLGGGGRAGSGLVSDLFWPDSNKIPLRLRPNFSFFDFLNPSVVTQAEVFFVMSSLLHQLRINLPGSPRLIQAEHQRTLIAPHSFYQFNDGIVQAALLRAARKAEIDYRVAERQSAAMREVVNSIFCAWDRPRGEAAMEFLIMLAMGHLQLVETDRRALAADFLKRLPKRSMAQHICRFILNS